MQVLLRQDVEGLGKIGDVVTVKPGYARNYLLARNIAIGVSPGNIKRVEREKQKAEATRQVEDQELAAMAERLRAVSVTIPAKANPEGRLFGSIGAAQIAQLLQTEGYKVEEKMIMLEEPLKDLGVVEVQIQLKPELQTSCKVWVVAE